MKGTVVKCIEEMVVSKFGTGKWHESLRKAGVPESSQFMALDDVPDQNVLNIMKAVGEAASLSFDQVMAAFGEYWATVYAPRLYKPYFERAKSTRELLLMLDEIHLATTRTMKMAMPPHFQYKWEGDNHLVMTYQSKRGLVALMPGLVAGLAKYYKDHPRVHLSGNAVHVEFA